MKTAENMNERVLPVSKDGIFSYNICLEASFDKLAEYISEFDTANRKLCIVTDSNVHALYAAQVQELLSEICSECLIYVIPAGEENKNLDEIQKIYEFLLIHHFDRNDILVALGGGVTGDMTGFAAATYLRGIRFIQIPTTLLSQVDSSIGGKTGVDFLQYKNMVGAFHQPILVYINLAVLKTLSDEQFSCGMGEILKHGLIKDADYYEWTISHMEEIEERDLDTLYNMVLGSCQIKRSVVENDPTEKGERALLNFGHTIGHAIEKLKDFTLLHGQCVSLGMVAAAYISWKRELLSFDEFMEIRDMNVGFSLPITFDGLSSEDVLAATKHDKKMSSGKIKFVLLKGIGKSYIDMTVTDEEMLSAIDSMNAAVLDRE